MLFALVSALHFLPPLAETFEDRRLGVRRLDLSTLYRLVVAAVEPPPSLPLFHVP